MMKWIVITAAEAVENETVICNLLFAAGLEILHLRKPGWRTEGYEQFITAIEPRYRERIVVHDHYELVDKYRLRGIHLRSGEAGKHALYPKVNSISCHSVEEIRSLPFRPSYCFLRALLALTLREEQASVPT